jgi:hypothetical protein
MTISSVALVISKYEGYESGNSNVMDRNNFGRFYGRSHP